MKQRDAAAFTLLEVLVALGVFALSVMGLMGALNSELSAGREARVEEDVLAQMQSQLALLRNEPLQSLQKTVKIDSPPMTFTESIAPREVLTSNHTVLDGFWTLSIKAEWVDEGTKQEETASVVSYGP